MSSLSLGDLLVGIVEPSPIQRRIITEALRDNGVPNVLHCDTGAGALEMLQHDSPDLVISAMYLPDMTGDELIHVIRASDAFGQTPFLLVSSETRFRYLDPIRQAGVVGILPKPFSDQALRTALLSTIDLIEPDKPLTFEAEALHVLVVDDSPLSRKHISRVLNALGICKIDHAADGIEALAMINQHLYDFVITDYNMPRMDGKELVDHIRRDLTQSSIPVLMVTSEHNENRLAAVQQSGVSAICDKPFEPSMVHGLVRSILAG
jgi:two-component system chemotaxis response regulator CheY